MRVPDAIVGRAGPVMGAGAIRLLGLTLRVRRDEASVRELWARGTPIIYAVWHSRMLLLPWLYGGRRVRVLTSRSRDGELAARVATRFGLEVIRGSSSRGGADALRALVRSLRDGWGVVMVPDGPRGPREVVKPGVIALAEASGAAIVPVAVGASSDWRLRSWDEFRVPRPGARCVVVFGEPVRVDRQGGRVDRQAMAKGLEQALHEVTARADAEAAA
ncbi:MAG TPA: lysophospholipid acyltransferase family protein [Candidatus Limnocylindrales bacterium]|nr:lysophospholipid acyltransferase family protein [Candidatus Limnocylindrales bacterium]